MCNNKCKCGCTPAIDHDLWAKAHYEHDYIPPAKGDGVSCNPYVNDPDCNEDNSRAMRWHREVLGSIKGQRAEFERAIPTHRRESAVELLLSLGFVWNNQRWEDRRTIKWANSELRRAMHGLLPGHPMAHRVVQSLLNKEK